MSLVGAAREPVGASRPSFPEKANYSSPRFVEVAHQTCRPTPSPLPRSLSPGIDLVYYGKQRRSSTTSSSHGCGPEEDRARLQGRGTSSRSTLKVVSSARARRRHPPAKPVVYQDIDGHPPRDRGGYVRKGANRVGFKVAAYDATRPLVIDPVGALLLDLLWAATKGTSATQSLSTPRATPT